MLEKKTYKNWKEICESMGWNTTGGAYKKARLKKLESLCAFDRVGNSFTIKEIYDTPKEIEDGRGKSEGSRNNNNQFQQYLIPLIKNLAVYSDSYSIIIPMSDVQDVFNFVSEIAVGKRANDYKLVAGKIECHKLVVKDILQSNYDNFTSVIRGAIRKIGEEAYWNARELIEVTRANGTKELLYGKETEEKLEESVLLATEEKEIKRRKIDKKHAKFILMATNQYLDFMSEVCSSMVKQGYDIVSYRKVLYCIAPVDHVAELNDFKLTKEQEEEYLSKIREHANISANSSAVKRHNKALKVEEVGGHKTARISKKKYSKEEISEARDKIATLKHKVQKTETIDPEVALGYVDESKKAIDSIIGNGINGVYSDTKGKDRFDK